MLSSFLNRFSVVYLPYFFPVHDVFSKLGSSFFPQFPAPDLPQYFHGCVDYFKHIFGF